MTDKSDFTFAAARGDLATVEKLYLLGINVRTDRDLAVKLAAANGHLHVVQYLHSKGTNIRAKRNYPLIKAVENGHFDVVKFLCMNGANIHAGDDAAFMAAVRNSDIIMIEYLCGAGININHSGDAALRLAIRHSNSATVKFLWRIGADVKTRNPYFRVTCVDNAYLDLLLAPIQGRGEAIEWAVNPNVDTALRRYLAGDASPYAIRGKNFLFVMAVQYGNLVLARQLYSEGISLDVMQTIAATCPRYGVAQAQYDEAENGTTSSFQSDVRYFLHQKNWLLTSVPELTRLAARVYVAHYQHIPSRHLIPTAVIMVLLATKA